MKQHSREELEGMTKGDLEALAADRELTVTRADGTDGDPRKSDYVDALASETSTTSSASHAHKAAANAPALDQTIPGGRYTTSGGVLQNAHGQRIAQDGTVLPPESEA